MKLIVPKYYKDFKCLGGACSDNCCIGWEIDIDEKTLKKYENTVGELGERLKNNISKKEAPHFVLCGERCPFLNKDNLCDIIIEQGEEYLCEICREHPRYYTTLGDRIYGGVGLSCEAAAELILTCESPTEFTTIEADAEREECDPELLHIVTKLRKEIFEIFEKNEQTIVYTIKEVINLASAAQAYIDDKPKIHRDLDLKENSELIQLFSEMDFMTSELPDLLLKKEQKNKISKNKTVNKYLHNIFGYFIHRYLPKATEDGFILGKIAVAAVSTIVISHLFSLESDLTLERAVYLSKLYSKEVEYNEDNIDLIEEYTEDIFL